MMYFNPALLRKTAANSNSIDRMWADWSFRNWLYKQYATLDDPADLPQDVKEEYYRLYKESQKAEHLKAFNENRKKNGQPPVDRLPGQQPPDLTPRLKTNKWGQLESNSGNGQQPNGQNPEGQGQGNDGNNTQQPPADQQSDGKNIFGLSALPDDYGMSQGFDDIKAWWGGQGDAATAAGNRALAYFAPKLVGALGLGAVASMLAGRKGGVMVPLLGAIGGFLAGGPLMDLINKMFGKTKTTEQVKKEETAQNKQNNPQATEQNNTQQTTQTTEQNNTQQTTQTTEQNNTQQTTQTTTTPEEQQKLEKKQQAVYDSLDSDTRQLIDSMDPTERSQELDRLYNEMNPTERSYIDTMSEYGETEQDKIEAEHAKQIVDGTIVADDTQKAEALKYLQEHGYTQTEDGWERNTQYEQNVEGWKEMATNADGKYTQQQQQEAAQMLDKYGIQYDAPVPQQQAAQQQTQQQPQGNNPNARPNLVSISREEEQVLYDNLDEATKKQLDGMTPWDRTLKLDEIYRSMGTKGQLNLHFKTTANQNANDPETVQQIRHAKQIVEGTIPAGPDQVAAAKEYLGGQGIVRSDDGTWYDGMESYANMKLDIPNGQQPQQTTPQGTQQNQLPTTEDTLNNMSNPLESAPKARGVSTQPNGQSSAQPKSGPYRQPTASPATPTAPAGSAPAAPARTTPAPNKQPAGTAPATPATPATSTAPATPAPAAPGSNTQPTPQTQTQPAGTQPKAPTPQPQSQPQSKPQRPPVTSKTYGPPVRPRDAHGRTASDNGSNVIPSVGRGGGYKPRFRRPGSDTRIASTTPGGKPPSPPLPGGRKQPGLR